MLDSTVKVHVKAILQKLGVKNRTQAAIAGMQQGHIMPDDAAG
jgi:DNA-binding NarL/FixJ family response regulator